MRSQGNTCFLLAGMFCGVVVLAAVLDTGGLELTQLSLSGKHSSAATSTTAVNLGNLRASETLSASATPIPKATLPELPEFRPGRLDLVSAGEYRYPYDPGQGAFNAKAMECLRQTTPELERLEYPDDAEEHFEELNRTMSKFTKGVKPLCGKISAGFCGPWLENHWIGHFSTLWRNRKNGTRLRDLFGPYIPILFPFLDIYIPNFYRYPKGQLETLNRTMRPNVLYLAVSQCDDGIFGHSPKRDLVKFRQTDFPNMLVMSAGGYGHVPLPLFKQEEDPVPAAPIMDRTYAASFMGSLDHGPKGLRIGMKKNSEDWGKARGKQVRIGRGTDWKEVMGNTSLNLSPRGFGRNSYRTVELFQMGLIPIYVHDKVPWLFYKDLWIEEKIGFFSTAEALGRTLDHAFSDIPKLLEMERRIRAMRETHFTPLGILDQISKFMTERDGGGDLRCQALPDSVL